MSLNHVLPKKISLVPKKHHGFLFILFLLGCVLPPLGESSLNSSSCLELATRGRSMTWRHDEKKCTEYLGDCCTTPRIEAFSKIVVLINNSTAVALRFGIGTDFFINVILCICGCECSRAHPCLADQRRLDFPCHFHK